MGKCRICKICYFFFKEDICVQTKDLIFLNKKIIDWRELR